MEDTIIIHFNVVDFPIKLNKENKIRNLTANLRIYRTIITITIIQKKTHRKQRRTITTTEQKNIVIIHQQEEKQRKEKKKNTIVIVVVVVVGVIERTLGKQ